jgi:hypothetical protein
VRVPWPAGSRLRARRQADGICHLSGQSRRAIQQASIFSEYFMRLPLSVLLLLLSQFPARAELEPICRAVSKEGGPVITMTKAGGTKPLAEVPNGTAIESVEIKKAKGEDWLLIYPDSILSRDGGWVKASEVTCEDKIETLWDFDKTEYADEDPEFYCAWPVPLGNAGTLINEFAFANRTQYGSNPAEDTFQVAGHPLPIRFWVDARADVNGETWLRAMYFDDENTVGWVRDSEVVCN